MNSHDLIHRTRSNRSQTADVAQRLNPKDAIISINHCLSLTMSIEKVLYRAHAKVTGGRDGRAVVPDGNLELKLTTPKELGGGGGDGTNPEQLFAAGYSACFLGAMKY